MHSPSWFTIEKPPLHIQKNSGKSQLPSVQTKVVWSTDVGDHCATEICDTLVAESLSRTMFGGTSTSPRSWKLGPRPSRNSGCESRQGRSGHSVTRCSKVSVTLLQNLYTDWFQWNRLEIFYHWLGCNQPWNSPCKTWARYHFQRYEKMVQKLAQNRFWGNMVFVKIMVRFPPMERFPPWQSFSHVCFRPTPLAFIVSCHLKTLLVFRIRGWGWFTICQVQLVQLVLLRLNHFANTFLVAFAISRNQIERSAFHRGSAGNEEHHLWVRYPFLRY